MFDVRSKVNAFSTLVKEYEEAEIQEGLIMFYGDSAFTRWKEEQGNAELEDVIRMKDGSRATVNHGLGGSTAEQLLYWYNRMVKAWKPRALVLKAYSNDLDRSYSVDEIIFLQARILEWARVDMPGIKMFVCDAQPQRKEKELKMTAYYHRMEYNERMSQYCAKHDDVTMVWQSRIPDLYTNPEDVGDYSKVRDDLFVEDGVHFNKEGYEIYKQFWLEQLDELL